LVALNCWLRKMPSDHQHGEDQGGGPAVGRGLDEPTGHSDQGDGDERRPQHVHGAGRVGVTRLGDVARGDHHHDEREREVDEEDEPP
jgi:hypothetical protein